MSSSHENNNETGSTAPGHSSSQAGGDDDHSLSSEAREQHPGGVPNDEDDPDLKDIEEEERRAKRELYIVIGIAVVVLFAVITAVSVVAVKNKPRPPPPSEPPRIVVMNDAVTEYNYLLEKLKLNPFNTELSNDLPSDPASLSAGWVEDETQPPHVRAAAWAIQADATPVYDDKYNLIRRFALATLYFAHEGATWTNNSLWLTEANHCDWYGVVCCRHPRMAAAPVCLGANRTQKLDNVIELALDENNLQGELSNVYNLLQELVVIDVSFNNIKGAIPSAAIGALPHIGILYFQHNQLSGEVSAQLRSSGSLHALFVQRNGLTGNWPGAFCPRMSVLYQIGLDCDEVKCSSSCCTTQEDCYRDPDTTNVGSTPGRGREF